MMPKSIRQIARAKGRDYITPEDVGDAVKSGLAKEKVYREVLICLGGVGHFGVEDKTLCAFIAVDNCERRERRRAWRRKKRSR